MSKLLPFRALLLTALGGLAGIGLGCVITVGPLDCSECGNTGCHSEPDGQGNCLCEGGYEFANDDPNDFECDPIPGKGGDPSCGGNSNVHLEGDVCVCDDGYNWCSDDLDDLTCCLDDNQLPGDGTVGPDDTGPSPTSTTANDTEPADSTADSTGEPPGMCEMTEPPGNGVEPLPEDCTEDGLVFCSNTEAEGPAGSHYWECVGGEWVPSDNVINESCQFDGFDFGYGCIDDGSTVTFDCGLGPGTFCSGEECNACGGDGDEIQFCADGKLGADSCNRICTEVGDDQGITYDFGQCVQDGSQVDCACCDSGEEGCPV